MPLIHILDDSKEFLETLNMVFPILGFQFDSSDNLHSFYRGIHQRKPDLIMIDMVAEQWEGGTICKLLKDHVHYKDVPIVLVSGHHRLLYDYTKYAADDVIPKPFDFLTLSKKINQQITFYSKQGVSVDYSYTQSLEKIRKLAVKGVEFIEDKDNISEMIGFILDVNGYTSYLAKDAMDLYLRLSRRKLPDLIIIRHKDLKKSETDFVRILASGRKNLIPLVILVEGTSPILFSNVRYHIATAPFRLDQIAELILSMVKQAN